MPPRPLTPHEKFYLATYLQGGCPFADMKRDLGTQKASELLERAMQMAIENPVEFRKILFEQVEGSSALFAAGGPDRVLLAGEVAADAAVVDGTVQLPKASELLLEKRRTMLGIMRQDFVGETIRALEEQAQAALGVHKADCERLIKYIREHANVLRPKFTLAVARLGANPGANAIGNAIIAALKAAAYPGLYQNDVRGVLDLEHPENPGVAPDNIVFEMMTVAGVQGRRAGRDAQVRDAFEHPPLARGEQAYAHNALFNDAAAVAQAIDGKVRAIIPTVAKEVCLSLVVAFERYAQQPDPAGAPINAIHRAAAAAAAKALRGYVDGVGHGVGITELAREIITTRNPARLIPGGYAANLAAVAAMNGAAVGAVAAGADPQGAAAIMAGLVRAHGAGVIHAGPLMTDIYGAVLNDVVLNSRLDAAGNLLPDPVAEKRERELIATLSDRAADAMKDPECKPEMKDKLKKQLFGMLEKAVQAEDKALHDRMAALEAKMGAELKVVVDAAVAAGAAGADAERQAAGVVLQDRANWRASVSARVARVDDLMRQLRSGGDRLTTEAIIAKMRGLKTGKTAEALFEASVKKEIGFDKMGGVGIDEAKSLQAQKARETLGVLESLARAQIAAAVPHGGMDPWLQQTINDVRGIINRLQPNAKLLPIDGQGKDVRGGQPAALAANAGNLHLALYELYQISTTAAVDSPKRSFASIAFNSMGYAEIAWETANAGGAVAVAVRGFIQAQSARLKGRLAICDDASQVAAVVDANVKLAEEIVRQQAFGGRELSISGASTRVQEVKKELEELQNSLIKSRGIFREGVEVQYKPSTDPAKDNSNLTIKSGGVAAMEMAMEKAVALWPQGIVVNGGQAGSSEREKAILLSAAEILKGNDHFTVSFVDPPANKSELKLLGNLESLSTAVRAYKTSMAQEGGSPFDKAIAEGRSDTSVPLSLKGHRASRSRAILAHVLEKSAQCFKDNPVAMLLETQRNLGILKDPKVVDEVKRRARESVATIVMIIEDKRWTGGAGVNASLAAEVRAETQKMIDSFGLQPAPPVAAPHAIVGGKDADGQALDKTIRHMRTANISAFNLFPSEKKVEAVAEATAAFTAIRAD